MFINPNGKILVQQGRATLNNQLNGTQNIIITDLQGEAPRNLIAPVITYSSLNIGSVLTCSTGTWSGSTPITYFYQWFRDNTLIVGATNNTYTLVFADIDTDITCQVTAENSISEQTEPSNAVPITWTLLSIVNYFGFSNAWSSENLTIAGTTTTANDYKGVHDLANPGATNQPTFNSSSANFGGKPSLSFNGVDDYLIKNVTNFNNVNSGFQIDVFKNVNPRALSTSDNATNGRYVNGYTTGGKAGFEIVFLTNRIIANTLTFNSNVANVLAWASNGLTYVISLNGSSNVGANLNVVTGANDGGWFNDVGARDNVSIGARISSTPVYYTLEWVFSGVGTNTSEADLNLLTSSLKSYYGL